MVASDRADGARPHRVSAGLLAGGDVDPDARPGSTTAALLAEVNAYLDPLAVTEPSGTRLRGTPPDLRFGGEAALHELLAELTGEAELRIR